MKIADNKYTLYIYRIAAKSPSGSRILFNSFGNNKKTVDASYVKKLKILPPQWLFNTNTDNDLGEDFDVQGNLKNKTAPFSKLYLVQQVSDNKYELIQVVAYIGDLFP